LGAVINLLAAVVLGAASLGATSLSAARVLLRDVRGIEAVLSADAFCLLIKREFTNCVTGVGSPVAATFFADRVKIFDSVLFVLNSAGVFPNALPMSPPRESNPERDIMLPVDAMLGNAPGVNLNVPIPVVGGGIPSYKLVSAFLSPGVHKEGRSAVFSASPKISCAARYSGVPNIPANGFAPAPAAFSSGGVPRGDGMIAFN
jgi:hypothetical protein